MYAVVRTGGKQYRVSSGEKLRIEKLAAAVGSELVFDEVLLVVDGQALDVGTPVVKGASVKAKIIGHGLGEKVMIFEFLRRRSLKIITFSPSPCPMIFAFTEAPFTTGVPTSSA